MLAYAGKSLRALGTSQLFSLRSFALHASAPHCSDRGDSDFGLSASPRTSGSVCRATSLSSSGFQISSAAGHLVAGKEIGVAGAGLAGLAFGLSILKACREQSIKPLPKVVFFERDASAEARLGQGYFLSVRSDSGGLQVLHELGVLEEAIPHMEPGLGVSLATAKFWRLFTVISPHPEDHEHGKLRISRSRLRQALLHKLIERGDGEIMWNKQCGEVKVEANGKVALAFQDGTERKCDILVVADGANSKVRSNLLPSEQPQHPDIVVLSGKTAKMDPMPKELLAGQWLCFTRLGTNLVMSTLDKTIVSWNLTWRGPQSIASELNAKLRDPSTAEEVYALAEEKSRALGGPWPMIWASTVKSGLRAYAPIQKPPHPNKAPVIFIGDSCHPMTPFSGNGANMALLDAWQLAQQLINSKNESLDGAIAAYDAQSAPRSAACIKRGSFNIRLWHRKGLSHYALTGFILLASQVFRIVQASMWMQQRIADRLAAWRLQGQLTNGHEKT